MWSQSTSVLNFIARYVFPLSSILSVIGSCILFIALIAYRQRANLSPQTLLIFCTLLAADVLYLIPQIFTNIYRSVHGKDISKLSSVICFGRSILQQTSLVYQGYLQCVISIIRALTIVAPLRAARLSTGRQTILVLLILFILILTSQAALVFYLTSYDEAYGCALNFGKLIMSVFPSIFECAIPSFVLIVATTAIVAGLIHRKKRTLVQAQRLQKVEVRLTLVLILIDVVYVISTLPINIFYNILHASYGLDNSTTKEFRSSHEVEFWSLLFSLLRYLSPASDWLFLLLLGRHVRTAFCRTIAFRCCE